MRGEIIAVGDELTSGRILNTTSSFAAGHLYGAGHDIIAISMVGDEEEAIAAALTRALQRAEFIIVTGGLGATSDDRTNEAVANILERPPTFYPEIFAAICQGDPQPLDCQRAVAQGEHPLAKLAWLPQGAKILKPGARMAGHLLVHDGVPIFFLPGVPHEMRELMLDCVLPMLAGWQGGDGKVVRQRIFRVFGLPETEINRRLAPLEGGVVRIGYYPVQPEVHVSLTVTGHEEEQVEEEFARAEETIRQALGAFLYGCDAEPMEAAVGRLLREKGLWCAVAESCTGGRVAARLTAVPGSSASFVGGVVAYSNSLKERLLAVPAALLAEHGAVSAPVARAMARGVVRATASDVGVAVTGVAGPGGGSKAKPVGLVYFALAHGEYCQALERRFAGDRSAVQAQSAMTALDLLRRHLAGLPLEGS